MEHTITTRAVRTTPVTAREREMRAILRRLDESGLTLREFGARVGILPGTLGFWRHEIGRRDTLRREGGKAGRPTTGPTFVPVRVVAEPPTLPSSILASAPVLEVELRGQRTVRVPAAFDAPTLARLVAVLEQLPC